MKELLARRLLDTVVSGALDREEPLDGDGARMTSQLTRLAALKYDEYEGFSPAVRFLESLAMWLKQYEEQDRMTALTFVLKRLVFISTSEIDHLVSTVYPDILRPIFRDESAKILQISPWRISTITKSVEFSVLQRRTLIMGMSDGARLDKLRRSSPLSTEQFHLVSVLDDLKKRDMRKKLARALKEMGSDSEPTFSTVIVVDDFTASGMTMLRPPQSSATENGAIGPSEPWEGKLVKLVEHLNKLKEDQIVHPDAQVIVLIYLMTQAARDALTERLTRSGYGQHFRLEGVHTFEPDLPLDAELDGPFLRLCDTYFDTSWTDEHLEVGGDPRFGFGESKLPLVLHHNAPNNTPPIVWKDTDANSPAPWDGLFPRHERHSSERR